MPGTPAGTHARARAHAHIHVLAFGRQGTYLLCIYTLIVVYELHNYYRDTRARRGWSSRHDDHSQIDKPKAVMLSPPVIVYVWSMDALSYACLPVVE